MPQGDRNPPGVLTRADEFAPGIPASRKILPIPRVAKTAPQEWGMATQLHEAERAGRHIDLRLVDQAGKAHSWALPKAELPKPGEKVLVVQQPTHTADYAAKKGPFLLPEGYGKGKVTGSGLQPVEVVSRRPGLLRFNVYGGRGAQEFAIVDTPKGQLLHNFTATRESGVRGAGGHEIPQSKPKYREMHADSVSFDDPNEVHQAKIDGAHVTFHLPSAGRQLRVFSYRPTERDTGVIEHTHKLPDFRAVRTPGSLAGTVVRGELWAADREGKALPAERVGGILNASVPRSRELQAQHGPLRAAIFDVVRYKGREMEGAPYEEKLKALEDVQRKVPFLNLPPTAKTPQEKERLFSAIQAGKLPETKEGIITWRKDAPGPTKVKFRPDVDAEVVGTFPGQGKHEGRVGGLLVKLPGQDAVTRVGTGFSDRLRTQIAKDPQSFIGRVAKVETQQVFPSGKLRAPSFKEFHIEKGKQAEMNLAMLEALVDELNKFAAISTDQVRRGTEVTHSFGTFQDKLRPGDVILTKPSDSGRGSVLSPVVKANDFLTGAKHPGWIHSAVYLGDGRIGHLDDKKLKRGLVREQTPTIGEDSLKLFDKTQYDLVALRPKSQAVADRAAERMRELTMAGEEIPVGKYLRNLARTGFNMPGVSVKDAVCTGIVGDTFRGARLANRDPLVMRPKDFLESRKLNHLVAYSRDKGS